VEWLGCFERVLVRAPERYGFPAEHLPGFRAFLDGFSLWMVNIEDATRAADGTGHQQPDGQPQPD
jgi:hypothetical protein